MQDRPPLPPPHHRRRIEAARAPEICIINRFVICDCHRIQRFVIGYIDIIRVSVLGRWNKKKMEVCEYNNMSSR